MKAFTKNSLSKRFVAVVLSMILSLSCLSVAFVAPSINASAASNRNLVGHFFANNTNNNAAGPNDLINNGNAIEWSAEENAAHFNSANNKQNYLKIKFSDIMPNARYIDGMTISFMAKDVNRSNSWARYFEITCANPYSGDNSSYLYASVNGNVKVKNSDYSNDETDAINFGQADGMWHKFTIVIENNYINVYRDNVYKGYTSNINIINDNLYNRFKDSGYFVFGASTYNDDAYEGYIKDFKVYDTALTFSEILDEGKLAISTVSDLKDAVAIFEQKMSSANVIYKNIKPAYDAYVVANRYIDAITYGDVEVDSAIILKLRNTLLFALNNMSEWSRSTFKTVTTKFPSDDAHGNLFSYDTVCRNLLWCSNVTYDSYTLWVPEQGVYTGSNKNTVQPAIFRPSAIMIYDGTDPMLPVMFLERLWKGGAFGGLLNMWTFYAGLTESQGMYMNENWRGTDSYLNYTYCYSNNQPSGLNYTEGEVDTFHKISRNNSKGEYKYYYANKLLFDGNSFGSNEYYREIKNLKWSFLFSNNDDPYYENGDSHSRQYTGTEGDKLGIQTNEVEQPIYVINYKAVMDEMARYKASNIDITSYKEGGLSSFLEKYDALANFDMTKEYTFDGNHFDDVRKCGERIGTLLSDVRKANKPDRKPIYEPLRQAIFNYNKYYTNTNLRNYYTEDSVQAFETAYEAATAKMADLIDNDYSTDNAMINSIASDVETTYDSLVRTYTLTFNDADGNLIENIKVEANSTPEQVMAVAPKLQDGIEGDYIVTYSWDPAIVTVTKNATYKLVKTQGYDVSAYNAAVANAQACINNSQYSQEDRDALAKVLEDNKVTASSTLEEIDSYTSAITSAINDLGVRKCNITYVYEVDNEVAGTETKTYKFGDVITLNTPENAKAYKWTYSARDNDYIIASGVETAQYTVNDDVVITVYATSNIALQNAEKARVILLDNSNKIVSISYASVGQEISFNNSYFTVNGIDVSSKKLPFYTANGFVVNENTYSAGSTYVVNNTNDIIIQSVYNA